jgi:hypothetical protein
MSLVTACALLVHYLCILVCTCALPWPMSPGLCVGLPPTSPRPGLRRLSCITSVSPWPASLGLCRLQSPPHRLGPHCPGLHATPWLLRRTSGLASPVTPRLPSHLASCVAPRFLCRTLLPMSDLASYVGPHFLCRASPPASRLASCIAPRLLRRASPPASHLASCVAPRLLHRTSPPWATYCHSPI